MSAAAYVLLRSMLLCLRSYFYEVYKFDARVTVHRDKFLKIKPTRCTNFSNLFLK